MGMFSRRYIVGVAKLANMKHRTGVAAATTGRAKALPGQVVLAFQGGGALNAYQGGVYQALHEAGIEPDWVIGTSSGAINAGIIAGNPPEKRLGCLHKFWTSLEYKPWWEESPFLIPSLGKSQLAEWTKRTAPWPPFLVAFHRVCSGRCERCTRRGTSLTVHDRRA
jgi:predicted acylesterase/phospholipase RssA